MSDPLPVQADVAVTVTAETPDPRVPAIADLFTPKQRALIYLLSVIASAAYVVVEANVDLHWGVAAGYAAWNALVGIVAVSNTPTSNRSLLARQRDLEVARQLRATADVEYGDGGTP